MKDLSEKVYQVGKPAEKRGAPTDKARAFDKVNARTGARKNRSVLKALEKARPQEEYFALDVSEDPDYTMVLVMKAGVDSNDYYGVNVLFYPDGRIEASTGDSLADKQWEKNKREIIKVAKKQLKTDAPMGDLDRDVRAYHGAGDGDYSGYKDKKMNEGKLSFKQFLLAEAKKIKEPGWYVVDHMDKPVDGPMQERGAKEMADEMNAEHAKKHGKGNIAPYSAEYYTDYEIKRMNEGKLALKQGGPSSEDASFGFESRKNAIAADKALKLADIDFTRTSAGGIQYFHFGSMALMRKGLKIVKPLVDKNEESEWGK